VNTGQGYSEIDGQAYIDSNSISVAGTADRGRLLFVGDRIAFNLDAADTTPDKTTLEVGQNVTLRFHYMSRLPYYNGQNVTFAVTVQATPSPPVPTQQPEAGSTAAPAQAVHVLQTRLVGQPVVSSPSACFCPASRALFICRRYFP
jgi:hypothetical protein